MAYTAAQITNLNNAMSANQDVSLGTLLSGLSDNLMVISGSFTPTAAVQTIATGLTTVSGVTVSLAAAPTLTHSWVTATAGSVAGTIVVSSWQPSSASIVTPTASTGSFVGVQWVAAGAGV